MQEYVKTYGLSGNSDKNKFIKYTNKDFSFISCTCCLLAFLFFIILGFIICIILPPINARRTELYIIFKGGLLTLTFVCSTCVFFFNIIYDSIQYYLMNRKQVGCKLNTKALFNCLKCFEDSYCGFLFQKEYTLMCYDEYVLTNVRFYYHDKLIKGSWLSYFFLINVYNYKKYKFYIEQKRLEKESKCKANKKFKERCKKESKETYEEMLKELQKLQGKEN